MYNVKFKPGLERFFMRVDGTYGREPPEGWQLRVFRRHKIVRRGEAGDVVDVSKFEYGIGEFYYENNELVGYNENPDLLKNKDLTILLMNIEELRNAIIKPIIIIEEVNAGKDPIIRFETRKDVEFEKRKQERQKFREQKRKGLTQTNE